MDPSEYDPDKVTEVACKSCDTRYELGVGIQVDYHRFYNEHDGELEPWFSHMTSECEQGHELKVINLYEEQVQFLRNVGVPEYEYAGVPEEVVICVNGINQLDYQPATPMMIEDQADFRKKLDRYDSLDKVKEAYGWK